MNTILSTKNLLQLVNFRSIPTQVLLCVAALLGCVSIMLAFQNYQTANNAAQANAPQVIIIIPAGSLKQVALPLPD